MIINIAILKMKQAFVNFDNSSIYENTILLLIQQMAIVEFENLC